MVEILHSVDPAVTTDSKMVTMAAELEIYQEYVRVFASLVVALAIVGTGLSLVGIFGVVAFGISRRTREIGIRIALGASSSRIARNIIGESSRSVGVGILLGVGLSLLLGRALQFLLFGVKYSDWWMHIAICIVFSSVGLLASALATRRAIRINPVVTLQAQ
jgi:ABC-type antimicrobial peptide transport system permease subunit